MSQTPQTQAESGCTSAFSDASDNLPDRSKIALHVPSVNATPLGTFHLVIRHSSFRGTNRRPPPHGINQANLLMYLFKLNNNLKR
jgi:hypothetical protein